MQDSKFVRLKKTGLGFRFRAFRVVFVHASGVTLGIDPFPIRFVVTVVELSLR